jgi:hypothetical protein
MPWRRQVENSGVCSMVVVWQFGVTTKWCHSNGKSHKSPAFLKKNTTMQFLSFHPEFQTWAPRSIAVIVTSFSRMLNCGYVGILFSWVGAHLMCMTWPEAWNCLYMHSVWACRLVAFNAPSSWQMHRPHGHCKGKKKTQHFPFQDLVAKKGEADADIDADLIRFWQNRETLIIIRTMECTIVGRSCAMESR